MEKTAIQKAIKKIDEQIEIAQVCRIEAAKVKDYDSMNRHYGKKIAFVFFRQELVHLLDLEKQNIIEAFEIGYENGACTNENESVYHGSNYYNKTFNKTK